MSKIKKVGILTQPLKNNFGGNLQAFALQHVINNLGFQVETINYTTKNKNIFYVLKNNLKKSLGLKYKKNIINNKDSLIQEQLHTRFLNENLKISPKIYSSQKLHKYINKNRFDTIIIGSDQVWRPLYSVNIRDFFINFTTNKNITKASYAASFGVDEWEFDTDLTNEFKKAIKEFHKISVREDSGVYLCEKNLNIKAELVLDPTLLLDKNTYLELFDSNSRISEEEYTFSYILDLTPEKEGLINLLTSSLNLNNIIIKNPHLYKITPSIENWLSSIYHAKFVITDSFHGMVFSLIFNKNFIVIANEKRGETRFQSLLKILKLEDRLVSESQVCEKILQKNINYNEVNLLLENQKEFSYSFINSIFSE